MSYQQNLKDWYQNYLGREPDQGGFNHYLGQLQGGRNLYEVAHEIQYSDEGRRYQNQQAQARNDALTAAQGNATRYQNEVAQLSGQLQGLQGQVQGYQSQISNLNNQMQGYQSQITGLQGQYQDALGQVQTWTDKAKEFETAADDWQDQFNKRTTDWETAQAEAQMYRDQAVGAQLRALRSGATSGGGNQTAGGQASLTGGKKGVQKYDGNRIDVEKNIRAESGALSNKGPVVQRIAKAPVRQGGNPGASTGAGGSARGGYYASRFS
tara:strand:- start:14925 stop:15725 length:801 start_codon:yes stop_codon:yes gene_type:complete